MDGEYKEKLRTGGELTVKKNSWSINYYFRGPDLRYNGIFVIVPDNQIDLYVCAWENNFKKYLKLKESIPEGANFEISGEMGMSIRIGLSEGVCLRSYHMATRTESMICEIISDYTKAKKRAQLIQDMMKKI